MRPEQLDPVFGLVPDHIRTLRVVVDSANAFESVARSASIQLTGELTPELLAAVTSASFARPGTERLLVPIFEDLFYCSNFDGRVWEPLLHLDDLFIERAAEHCYYVLALSGATGIDELIRSCVSPERRSGARRALDHVASLQGSSRDYVDHLRNRIL